jgi:hypothetical protein
VASLAGSTNRPHQQTVALQICLMKIKKDRRIDAILAPSIFQQVRCPIANAEGANR